MEYNYKKLNPMNTENSCSLSITQINAEPDQHEILQHPVALRFWVVHTGTSVSQTD